MLKKEFIQAMLDETVQKRVFAAFPQFKKNDPSNIQEAVEKFKTQPIFKMAKNTGQDLDLLKEMALQSFDKAAALLRTNVETYLDAMTKA